MLNIIKDRHKHKYINIIKDCFNNYTCLSVILLDSIINVNEKYYRQVSLRKCKNAEKKKKIMSKMKELKSDASDRESDNEFDKYHQNIYDGLH